MHPGLRTFSAVIASALAILLLPLTVQARQQPSSTNPFLPPRASVHYAPDRDYDLRHVAVTLAIDYEKSGIRGEAVNILAPLRDGIATITLHCGKPLTVSECLIDGRTAPFTHEGDLLKITAPGPLPRGREVKATVRYTAKGRDEGGTFGDGGGFHWIRPTPTEPERVGFWTQGETMYNRNWVPLWDFPNDFATTESIVTVPQEWTVVGNGVLVSDRVNKARKTRTFHWKMTQPHATYLLSLVGGPLDVKKTKWRDVPLWYVAPRGMGHLLEDSFGDTPEMLTFFSRITGVKYPWPKYAQNAMHDFGGGMENVSATTLGAGNLTDAREGFRRMASLNAHELAHQWFGDLVTCRDWGHVWLNESFATFFEGLYMEHSRGRAAYDRDMDGNMQGYFGEARRYRRPLATNLYPAADSMFDSHAYPKGAVVLHTLRRRLGDAAFFAGIQRYLTVNRHQPVETRDLEEALTEASGINVAPFFDQWVYKPGHPVLDYAWAYDEAKKEVVLTVRQTQDTADGTPVYDLQPTVGVIVGGVVTRTKAQANKAEQEIRIPAPARPDAVLLDPDRDFLREIPNLHWAEGELPHLVRHAPSAVDRAEAMRRMLAGTPSDAAVRVAVEAIRADRDPFLIFPTIAPLTTLKREDVRPLLRELLTHPNADRRSEAVAAFGMLTPNAEDTKTLRVLALDEKAPYGVAANALTVLSTWDAEANADIFAQAARMPSHRDVIRGTAFRLLANLAPDKGVPLLIEAAGAKNPVDVRQAAYNAMRGVVVESAEAQIREALRAGLRDPSPFVALTAAQAAQGRRDKELLPDLRALERNPPPGAPGWYRGAIAEVIRRLEQ